MKKRNVKFYNVFFPVWLLFAHPLLIAAALPINLLVDFLVVFLAFKAMKVENAAEILPKKIFRTWGLGFAADAIGAAVLFFLSVILGEMAPKTYELFGHALFLNPFSSPLALIMMILVVALVGVLIYFFNASYVFYDAPLSKREKHRTCLALAIATAPYLFFLPTAWFV